MQHTPVVILVVVVTAHEPRNLPVERRGIEGFIALCFSKISGTNVLKNLARSSGTNVLENLARSSGTKALQN